MPLLPHLSAELQKFPAASRYLVAYSGGIDSHVLLRALVALREQWPQVSLAAMHIDHGLHPNSNLWAQHCAQICATLQVPLLLRVVQAQAATGESPEDAARNARYAALAQELKSGDVLLTAHHQDDQAETLLLQLLRGAGPRGLAAMPAMSPLGAAWMARPLLGVSRAVLRAYAEDVQLRWIDDPSNSDTRFDRNYLRAEILPNLKQRWPAAAATLARSAQHCADAAELLETVARQDLHAVQSEAANAGEVGSLSIARLLQLPTPRQRNVLRLWIEQCGLPLPQQRHLEHVLSDAVLAPADAEPCVRWPGVEVRRYRDALHAMQPLPELPDIRNVLWQTDAPLHIEGLGRLKVQPASGAGLSAEACREGLRVAFRDGGERIKPPGRAHHATLKHLFQEAGVPPWQRERVPLLFIGSSLVAVAGHWIADEFAARSGEPGWVVDWAPVWCLRPARL